MAMLVVGSVSGVGADAAVAQDETGDGGHFSDDDGSVHERGLEALAARGVLAGMECGEGLICPEEPLKRWEMAVWLVRVLDGADPEPIDASRFVDVDAELWWAPFADRLFELEVTVGCRTEPARFCPERNVIRAQMATFLKRAFDLEPAASAGFTDVEADGTHSANIDALAAAGITVGCRRDPLRYCPDRDVNRAQMATFLARALGLIELPAEVRFTAIDAGDGHTCALRADGTISCWGANEYGQADAPDGEFLAVSAGGQHSCAIRTDRTVLCWGSVYPRPFEAASEEFQSVSAGFGHTCGLRIDGTISCWGGDVPGAPDGPFDAVTAGFFFSCAAPDDGAVTCWPSPGSGEEDTPDGSLVSLSAGSTHACGLRSDSTIACWGGNFDGQSDAPEGRFREVSAGGEHTCALTEIHEIVCWGNSRSGRIEAPRGDFRAVSAGGTHSCGLRANGTVVCWGDTADGRSRAPEGHFTAVGAGGRHTCGLLTNATIACWGYKAGGRTYPPVGEFMDVAVGWRRTCGLRTDSTLVCWGESHSGQADVPDGRFEAVSVGDSSSCGLRTDATVVCWGEQPVAEAVPAGSFEAVTAGSAHACALRADGRVTCWGEDQFGETEAPDGRFEAVSAGLWYSCGLRTDATVVCWGEQPVAEAVPAGSFEAVAAGPLHACALRADGSVACWGQNRRGEADPPDGRFRSVSAGESHSCGVRWDYAVVCWGSETVARPSGVGSPDAPNRPDPAACRPYGVSSFTTAGFPLHPSVAPSTGAVRVAVLFMDFPDAAASYSTRAEAGENLAFAERYLEEASYGALDIQFVPLHQWLRSEHEHAHYETEHFGLQDFDSEAASLADPHFDFSQHDILMTVLPSQHFGGGTATGSVNTDEGVVGPTVRINSFVPGFRLDPRPDSSTSSGGVGTVAQSDGESTEPGDWGWVAAHELLHALGIPDLYPVGRTVELIEEPPGKLRFWAAFGIMGLEAYFLLDEDDERMLTYYPGRGGETLAWSRWQLGWLQDDQVGCVTGDDATFALEPVAADPGTGTAMATVPLTANQAIVVESRRLIGRDGSRLIEEGVLVYEVNASISTGNLPIKVVGVPDEGFPVLEVGESLTVRGYTITVVADDGDTHTVTITKADDDG